MAPLEQDGNGIQWLYSTAGPLPFASRSDYYLSEYRFELNSFLFDYFNMPAFC